MPIVQNIPRKTGRIVTDLRIVGLAKALPLRGVPVRYQHGTHHTGPVTARTIGNMNVFGPRGKRSPNVGSVGKTYQSPLTDSNVNVLGTFRNTATLPQYPQTIAAGVVANGTVGPSKKTMVQPHERGTFFTPGSQQAKVKLQQRVSGGVDKGSNTPFHAQPQVTYRQKLYPATAGERTRAISFASNVNLVGNPKQDSGGSRWGTVKKGAAG